MLKFFSGLTEERPSPRHLLPALEVSGPPVAPRAQARRTLHLRLPPEEGGGLRQSLSLLKSRPTNSTAGPCTDALQE